VFVFRGSSWVQVKDRNGALLIAETGKPGTTQSVSGLPPLEVVVGNASGVSARFRGQPLDLAPHVRGNVARLTLP
jgi:cytoskeleton protein RodZ